MSSLEPSVTGPEPEKELSAELHELTADQLSRWAELISCNEAEFPEGLAPAQEEALKKRVQILLRRRLVDFIARQIARSLQRSAGSTEG